MGKTHSIYDNWATEQNLSTVRGWAQDGISDAEMCKRIGIGRRTLYEWKKKHAEFNKAISSGKEVSDYRVQLSLFDSCLGQKVTLKKPVKTKKERVMANGEKYVSEVIEYVDEEIFIPPNTTAQIYWMKVRKKWNDRLVEDGNFEALEKMDAVLNKIKVSAQAKKEAEAYDKSLPDAEVDE